MPKSSTVAQTMFFWLPLRSVQPCPQFVITSLAAYVPGPFPRFRPDKATIRSAMVTFLKKGDLSFLPRALPAGSASGRHNECSNICAIVANMEQQDVWRSSEISLSLLQLQWVLVFRLLSKVISVCLGASLRDPMPSLITLSENVACTSSCKNGGKNGKLWVFQSRC